MRSWQSEQREERTQGNGPSSACQGGEGEVLDHVFRADSMEKFLGSGTAGDVKFLL